MFSQCLVCGYTEKGHWKKGCSKCGCIRYRLHFGKPKITLRKGGRWSKAMGIHPNQVEEFKRHYPDRKYHPKTGDLWVESYQTNKRFLKENHLVDLN